MPPNTAYVGRGSKWGNPFVVSADIDREECVSLYRQAAFSMPIDASELRGKNLACWCALDQPCHADVLLELANAEDSL